MALEADRSATQAAQVGGQAPVNRGRRGPLRVAQLVDEDHEDVRAPALQAGSVTVSPLPGSRDASPETQISFLSVPARALAHVSVIGSRTGRHAGRVLAYSQGDGASFVPARRFAEGERVQVRASIRGS